MNKPRILVAIGTRPEAIKMAPVIAEIRRDGWAEVTVLATAQHRNLMDQVLEHFQIVPDIDLDLMTSGQTLAELTGRLVAGVDKYLIELDPDAVLVQGDTTTVFSVALASFYRHVPVGHVEAGLRTGDFLNPFPEEANRVLTSKLVKWHFAPTESSRQNLVDEGYNDSDIFVTGNTVIDALLDTHTKAPSNNGRDSDARSVLVTCHRRENFGEPLAGILQALKRLAVDFPDVHFIFPVHPNPNVLGPVNEALGSIRNFKLVEPLEYPAFVEAMAQASFIISDSGGVQEEAPALGKPVLVLREETERPEAVSAGVVKLVGVDPEVIYLEAHKLLTDSDYFQSMAKGVSPYGDGLAGKRINSILKKALT